MQLARRPVIAVLVALAVAFSGLALAATSPNVPSAHAAKKPGKKLSLKMWRAVDPGLNCDRHPRNRTTVSTKNKRWGLIRLSKRTCGSGKVLVKRSGRQWQVARGLGTDFGVRGSCSRVQGVPKKVVKDLLKVKCRKPNGKPRRIR